MMFVSKKARARQQAQVELLQDQVTALSANLAKIPAVFRIGLSIAGISPADFAEKVKTYSAAEHAKAVDADAQIKAQTIIRDNARQAEREAGEVVTVLFGTK